MKNWCKKMTKQNPENEALDPVLIDVGKTATLSGDKILLFMLGVDLISFGLVRDICETISDPYGSDTLRCWLFGTNGHLQGRAPAAVIREAIMDHNVNDLRAVLNAANTLTH